MAITKLNDRPVNRMAASMFWKTPWWAEVKEEIRAHVAAERLSPETVNIDYFKLPPDNIADRRGTRIVYLNGEHAIIIGYASSRPIPRGRKQSPASRRDSEARGYGYKGVKPFEPKKVAAGREHRWWVLRSNGSLETVRWDKLKAGHAKGRLFLTVYSPTYQSTGDGGGS